MMHCTMLALMAVVLETGDLSPEKRARLAQDLRRIAAELREDAGEPSYVDRIKAEASAINDQVVVQGHHRAIARRLGLTVVSSLPDTDAGAYGGSAR